MTKKVIESNDHYDLFYHPEDKIVHHVFKEKLDSQSFPEVLNRGTEVLEQNRATKWLADNLQQKNVLTDEDNNWATTVWFPRTKALGWKYWAIVVPESMPNRADLVRYVEYYYEQGIVTRVFSDETVALHWLQSVDKA